MNLTYNQIIKISRAFQQAHHVLKNFGNGGEADMVLHNQQATYKYPLIWMNDAPSTYVEGLESFNFRVFFLAPAVTLKERGTDLMSTNVNEVKSDMIQCANDFITYWIQQTDNYNTLGFDKSVNRDSVDKYTDDNLTGCYIDIRFYQPLEYDECAIPMGTPTSLPDTCAPVLIYEDGILVDTIASGGTYSYTSGGGGVASQTVNGVAITDQDVATTKAFTIRYANNDPVVVTTITDTALVFIGEVPDLITSTPVSNSDDTYSSTVTTGVSKELPDVTMTQPNGDTLSYPSVKNFSCTLINALLDADLISNLTDAQVQAVYEGRVTINEVKYTTVGSDTYTKPANLLFAVVMCIGGGGGGASGQSRPSGSASGGGGGGGNSGIARRIITNAEIIGAQTVIVGEGGVGGAGRTTDGTQNGGTTGGSSSFGTLVLQVGGNGGTNGTTTAGGLTSQLTIIPSGLKANSLGGVGGNGGAASTGAAGQTATALSSVLTQGGAGGGGATNAGMTTAGNGGSGGRNFDATMTLTTQAFGGVGSTIGDATNGNDGTDANTLLQISLVQDLNTTIGFGNPGGGGGASTAGNGGNGGNGSLYGMSGGGGGGCITGFTSGSGGNGSQGCVIIHEFLV